MRIGMVFGFREILRLQKFPLDPELRVAKEAYLEQSVVLLLYQQPLRSFSPFLSLVAFLI